MFRLAVKIISPSPDGSIHGTDKAGKGWKRAGKTVTARYWRGEG